MSWLSRLFSKARREDVLHKDFGGRLETLGFLRFATPEQAAEIREELEDRGWPGVYSHDGRFFHADAEDLAEGGVAGFLETIGPVLTALSVTAVVEEDGFSADEYWLRVSGRRWVIYSPEELGRDGEGANIWALATIRTFGYVNEMLADAGATERLYAVNGGNDLSGIFLTPEQLQVIHEDAGRVPGRPYAPVDDPPGYGDVF